MTPASNTPKSFREFSTLELARMTYVAMDTPASVLAERVLKLEFCHECDELVGDCKPPCHMAVER